MKNEALTVKDAAREADLTPGALHAAIRKGLLRSEKNDGVRRVLREDLREYMKANPVRARVRGRSRRLPEGYVDTKEAGEILGIKAKAVRSAIFRGSIRAIELDGRNGKGRLGVSLKEIERYKAQNRAAIPDGYLTTAQAAEELADCGVTLFSLRSAITRGEVEAEEIPFRSGLRRKIISRAEVERIRTAHESDGPKWQLFC